MQLERLPGFGRLGPTGQCEAHLASVDGDDHCSMPVLQSCACALLSVRGVLVEVLAADSAVTHPPTHEETRPIVTLPPRARNVSRPVSQHRLEKPERVVALAATQVSLGTFGFGGHMTPLL